MDNKILLVTNGCTQGWATIQYATEMAKIMKMPLTLLGIVEKFDMEHPVEEIFSRAVSLFQEKKIAYDLQLVNGDTEDVLEKMSWDDKTYLFVGPLGRSQFRQWFVGRSFRKILEKVSSPIFYVREARLPIKKILMCFGGLDYTSNAEKIGLEIGRRAGAEVKFLHVVPPVESEHLPTQETEKKPEKLIDKKPAKTLEKAQEHADDEGVETNIVVRQGNIVQQIIEELETQNYDLVCMGSSFSHPDKLRQYYAPNVTAEVAEAVNCPILSARAKLK
ncbi:MAG: universal stress protein [Anaerolineae bacterium]|jgi:nucleotide-binding universal stress UspA family protein|nr:universal stress protein [Anaerolineae bacterium]MBT7073427.1 universal stress protein [Anaerolineae bacterium]MBT7781800.1 universal stress protein [Anaerolineae bacterium]